MAGSSKVTNFLPFTIIFCSIVVSNISYYRWFKVYVLKNLLRLYYLQEIIDAGISWKYNLYNNNVS